MKKIELSQNYGRLYSHRTDAERAIETRPDVFPAGNCYGIEIIRKRLGIGGPTQSFAAVYACDTSGEFLGYVARPDGTTEGWG
jgi:hypothetical protein